MEQATPIRSPYLTTAEAAAYCRMAVRTFYNRRSEIKRANARGRLLFKVEDLDAFLRGELPRREKKVDRPRKPR